MLCDSPASRAFNECRIPPGINSLNKSCVEGATVNVLDKSTDDLFKGIPGLKWLLLDAAIKPKNEQLQFLFLIEVIVAEKSLHKLLVEVVDKVAKIF